MGTARKSNVRNTNVELYDKLIAIIPKIERKGAANPYPSLNGNMFTLLHQSNTLAIRFPEDRRDEFLKKYKTNLFEAHGAVMKESITVPDSLLKNTKELRQVSRIQLRIRQDKKAQANQEEVLIGIPPLRTKRARMGHPAYRV